MLKARIVVALAALSLASSQAFAEEATAEAVAPGDVAPAAEALPPASTPRSVDALIDDLGAPLPGDRAAAIQALAERGDPAAVAPLARVLRGDSSVLVRGWAVRALAQLGTPAANEALATAALSDPDQRVRSLAARLAGISPETAEPIEPAAAPPPRPAPVEVPTPRPRATAGYSLRVAGWVVLAASYGIALITGTILLPYGGEEQEHGWKLLLPVVGPAIAAATAPLDDDWEREDWATPSIFLWIFTGVQATGLILLSVGYAERAAELREDRDDDAPARSRRASRPGLVLGAGPGDLPGLSVAGWF